ncbi:MAG: hypothetical protein AABW64_00725 [Nanoarchaeota archaeon]
MQKRGLAKKSFYVTVFFVLGALVVASYFAPANTGQVVSTSQSFPNILPGGSKTILALEGLDNYRLSFTNSNGVQYSFRYLSAFRNFMYGDANNEFVFSESPSVNVGNIGLNDYFVLSFQRDPSDIGAMTSTSVLKYIGFDLSTRAIDFQELSTYGTYKTFVFQCLDPNPNICLPGKTTIVQNGNSYIAYVVDNQGTLTVDLNGDGVIQGTKVNLVAYEQSPTSRQFTPVLIDLGNPSYSGNGKAIPIGTPIQLALHQGDPSVQRVITDVFTITAQPIPGSLIKALQIQKVTSPH